MSKEIEKEIQNLTDKIVKEYKPEKIILFGSYAWGKPDKSSDVDFFIVKNTRAEKGDRFVTVSRILKKRRLPTDIIVYTPDELATRLDLGDFFIKRIVNEGKLLYEKR